MTPSSTLFRFRSRAARSVAVPVASLNMRSKTSRGSISIGSGVVGDDHEMVFMYAQLNPGVQPPT